VIKPKQFFDSLNENSVHFFSGIPDSLLKNICAYITDNTEKQNHIIAANEGNALSIGIGYHLATGKIPLIYMQNSGLGNIVNPLLSLADPDVYSIPMLLMIGWRGEPRVKDEPQHKKQGRVTIAMLDSMEVPYEIISPDKNIEDVESILQKMLNQSKQEKRPCAILIKKGVFDTYKFKSESIYDCPLSREQTIKIIIDNLDKSDIVVSTTGVTSRELFEYRKNTTTDHYRDFLTVGGMGHTSQIALGIALQKRNRKVYCLDGDGSLIMHMGTLAINASMNCSNFKHIVFNNSAHDSVGGQPTVGKHIDMQIIASAAGYKWSKTANTENEIISSIKELSKIEGPAFLEIQVKKGFRKDLGRPSISPLNNKEIFMNFIANDV